jgi:ankyrin repeat protein
MEQSISEADKENISNLFGACRLGHLQEAITILDELNSKIGDINNLRDVYNNDKIDPIWEKDTPLIAASRFGHIDVVMELLRRGSNANSMNKNNDTALMVAADNGHSDVVKELLKISDIQVDRHNPKRAKTASMIAFDKGNYEIVEELLRHGANIEYLENSIVEYIKVGNIDKVIKCLEYGVNLKTIYGDKSDTLLIVAIKKRNLDIVNLLVNKGSDLRAKNSDGDTPLIMASRRNSIEIVSYLLKTPINLNDKNDKNEDGFTALMYAANNGRSDIVSILIDNGSNIDLKNDTGDTALILAARRGHIDVVNVLIGKGANVFARDSQGRDAEYFARVNHHDQIAHILESKKTYYRLQDMSPQRRKGGNKKTNKKKKKKKKNKRNSKKNNYRILS